MSYEHVRRDFSQAESTDNLAEEIKKRIKTTMIGSIAVVEEYFSFLWEQDAKNSQHFKEIFQEARSKILDKGNGQLRSVDSDLSKYRIETKYVNYKFPIKRELGE
jgi:hypothetical protein